MPETTRRARPSDNVARAVALLKGGLIGGHLAALVVVGAFLVGRGAASAASAAVAAAVTLAFYTVGLAVQVAVADAPPSRVLFASLASYGLRVTVLGLLLAVSLSNAHLVGGMDPVAVVVATVAVVVCWLVGEFWVYARLRIPVHDPPEE
jgi:ATP synthase protein I